MSVDPKTTQDTIHLFVEAKFSDAPEWIPLLPTPGIYPHPTYGDVDMSPEAIDRYVTNFNSGVYGQNKIPIDLEHDLPLSGAMGYMTEVRKNENGSVDARVEWNERGRTVLAENRFGYVSPTLREQWTDPVSMKTHRNVTVGAALTTRPYWKEQSLRPLIQASEPVDTSQEGTRMTEQEMQAQKDAATAEGASIVEKQFGEKLAAVEQQLNEAKAQVQTFADRLTAAETENAALKADAQERTFSEALKGCTDVPGRIAELKALPTELHEGYIKRAQAERDARRSGANFSENGTDALGEASAKAKLNARAEDIRKSDPKLTKELAFSEACRQDAELYRQYRAESQA